MPMKVHVQVRPCLLTDGKSRAAEIEIDGDDSIASLKNRIADELAIPQQLQLLFAKHPTDPTSRPLNEGDRINQQLKGGELIVQVDESGVPSRVAVDINAGKGDVDSRVRFGGDLSEHAFEKKRGK